jgi:hypothetical protein
MWRTEHNIAAEKLAAAKIGEWNARTQSGRGHVDWATVRDRDWFPGFPQPK